MCFYKQINQAHKVPDESPWQEEQNHWRQRTQEDVIIFCTQPFFYRIYLSIPPLFASTFSISITSVKTCVFQPKTDTQFNYYLINRNDINSV